MTKSRGGKRYLSHKNDCLELIDRPDWGFSFQLPHRTTPTIFTFTFSPPIEAMSRTSMSAW